MKLALRSLQRRTSLQPFCRTALAAMCIFNRDNTLETILRSSRECFRRIGRKWNLRLSAGASNVRLRTLSHFIECKVNWNLKVGRFCRMRSHSETSFRRARTCTAMCKIDTRVQAPQRIQHLLFLKIIQRWNYRGNNTHFVFSFHKHLIVERFNSASRRSSLITEVHAEKVSDE